MLRGLVPPLVLITAVLGSILMGLATPTEAAGVGAFGAMCLAALQKQLNLERLHSVLRDTMSVTAMVFLILVGAAIFSLVFRGFGGDELIQELFARGPDDVFGATLIVMVVIFFLDSFSISSKSRSWWCPLWGRFSLPWDSIRYGSAS